MTNEPQGKFCDSKVHDNALLLKVEEAKLIVQVSDKEFRACIDEVNARFRVRHFYSLSNTLQEDDDVPCKLFVQHVNNQEKIMFHMNEKIKFQSEIIANLQKDNSEIKDAIDFLREAYN
eukprot:6281939-Ditylum_brightwellii.AAC.1